MLSLLLHTFTSVYLLTVTAHETVVGVAGKKVTLPCRVEAANKKEVEVCWGKGRPSLFTCHNAVVNIAGGQMSYRKSYRFSVSSASLNILSSRSSDTGFYHCRVQLPGLFNDQMSTVHLIITGRSSELQNRDLNAPHTTTTYSADHLTTETGSDVITTGPMVALVQSPVQQQQQFESLLVFVSDTLRLSFIIFIPAVLLAAAHRVWRSRQQETKRCPAFDDNEGL